MIHFSSTHPVNSSNNAHRDSGAQQKSQAKSVHCQRLRLLALNLGLESDFGVREIRKYYLDKIARECN
ncbi:hypothetical protein HMI55_004113 [Coelomomyces lativittatus]|nr:hypothetical protein HMI55_004113 [Coelomomyces lativittatus]